MITIEIALTQQLLLYEMINHPLFSIKKLHEGLMQQNIDMSYHKTKMAFEELKRKGVLRSNTVIDDPILVQNQRLRTEVEGNYNPSALGLQTQHVIFKNIRSPDTVELFANICDEHPYTHYRAVCIGNGVNLYAQFDIPDDITDYMAEFYEKINEHIGGRDIVILNQDRCLSVDLDLRQWSNSEHKWNFSISGTENSIQHFWDGSDIVDSLDRDEKQSHLDELDWDDLNIIRELCINAKIKPVELSSVYHKDASTISRRIKRINTTVMNKPSLYYNRAMFDLSTIMLILGKAQNAVTLNKLYEMLRSDNFPFRSNLISDGLNFRLILYAPPNIASEVAYFIWSKTKNVEVMILNIAGNNSCKYPFYPSNFDQATKYWKISKSYVLDDVLGKIA